MKVRAVGCRWPREAISATTSEPLGTSGPPGILEALNGWRAHVGLPGLCAVVLVLHLPVIHLPPTGLLYSWDQADSHGKQQQRERNRSGQQPEGPSNSGDIPREIARIQRDLQFALEGGSAQGVLSLIDSAKFRDYASFRDTVERLLREDTVRAYFRQVSGSSSAEEGRARSRVDAEMQLARKDAAGQMERRRQELELEFERTGRGWRITNIGPRKFFEPL